MAPGEASMDAIFAALKERAKELQCLYRVDEILGRGEPRIDEAIRQLVAVLPGGWQYPDCCVARAVVDGRVYEPPGYVACPWQLRAPVVFEGEEIGEVSVCYTEPRPEADEGPFLEGERRLLNAIAERLGQYLLQRRLRRARDTEERSRQPPAKDADRWSVILDFVRRTDRNLLVKLTRRMINHLAWSGVGEAERLLRGLAPAAEQGAGDENRPLARVGAQDLAPVTEQAFRLAAEHLTREEILDSLLQWINEDRAGFLYTALENTETSLEEIAALLERFQALGLDPEGLPAAMRTGLVVALLRRFFTDDLDYLHAAKPVVELGDFLELSRRTLFPPQSHGKLGGKAGGLFLAACTVKRAREVRDVLGEVRVPKSWYLASDALLYFIRYNNLEEVYDRKYRDVEQIRQEYPYLVQVFKESVFPPDIAKALYLALDELGEVPIIVRSSSLLEDRFGSAFSGKYKSLFLANQGGKDERLAALLDAIAEIYASVFGPEPIEYRSQRALLDIHEEMGVLLQQVVGRRVGPYFFPAFSGVAFSHNELRWSKRIRRQDGLLRMVPGLGTRAVDRLADDYPVLVAPGQPGLRVNTAPEEVLRYAPKKADVINLETGTFETVAVDDLLRRHGSEYPGVHRLVSIFHDGHLRKPVGRRLDPAAGEPVVTFEGLIADSGLVAQVRTLLELLQQRMGVPVDLEFASDGEHFYLLQCRPQGYSPESAPTPIPRDLPGERVLFTAHRFVSNGRVPDVTHVVYVDDEAYASLPDPAAMRRVGEAVGRLNKLLPKRQFALVGPGRWGSRGDIRLGVAVSYSQINNTALLVEVARQRGHYLPDPSFGTHFFQDLVESEIRYLPLYPDDAEARFNELFFRRSPNLLPELLPEHADLAGVLRVIDVRRAADGRVLRVLMNGELDEAVGFLDEPADGPGRTRRWEAGRPAIEPTAEDHWRWRLRMAERMASLVDAERFGVVGFYVFGSTKNAVAGPASDLDLLVHVRATPQQREQLLLWLDGWSRCLAEVNFLRTGYRSDGLLDVHLVTDDDIERRTSFASKIGAVTDAARPLPMGPAERAASDQL